MYTLRLLYLGHPSLIPGEAMVGREGGIEDLSEWKPPLPCKDPKNTFALVINEGMIAIYEWE